MTFVTEGGHGPPITPPEAWTEAMRTRRLPHFDPAAHRRVVVVAAHPDDETLGAGGVLHAMLRAGAVISLVVATDGEAAYPGLSADGRRELAAVRRQELEAALRVQGLGDIQVSWLGLPDSGLQDRADDLLRALAPLLADADAYLAPWPRDPHPDHRATGLAVAAAAPVTTHGWSYPIWMWAWTKPTDPVVPWHRAQVIPLDEAARAQRRRAVECFRSQTGPGPDGSPAVLAAGLLDHVDRAQDLVFREPRRGSAPIERFAALYADGNDPWGTDQWYERRKRAQVLASLPRERYDAAFEPACGTGELTVELAGRCGRIQASDPVEAAVDRARALVRRVGGVAVSVGVLPDVVPSEPFDLAVFSEVLYYLDDSTLTDVLDRTLDAIAPGGDVVLVHWRGWPAEAPRDAADTHQVFQGRSELEVLVEHVDEEFLLHVLRRR